MNFLNFVKIAWFGKHFGEEPPLVGKKGSGTIFFSGCNLRCVYCQNYQISQQNVGQEYGVGELAKIMLQLQEKGVLNINLVSPTIWAEPIKEAVREAKEKGLLIPVVWNSNAYERRELIKGLEGLVDIYLPDFKYGDNNLAFKYSGIKDYVQVAKEAIKAMYLQVGNLKISKEGTAQKGIIVRHLILPNNIENSFKALKYIREIDQNIHINLMSQYEPVNRAKDFPEINRNINQKEFEKVFDYLLELGFENGWAQDLESHSLFLPDFTKKKPFG